MTDLIHIPVVFRQGTRLPAAIDDPQVVNRALAELRQPDGDLLASDIVDAASNPANPLHAAFEWDDAICGEKWRSGQAFYLAGSLIDTRTGEPVYVSRHRETNNPADTGRIRINVRMLPAPEEPSSAQKTTYTIRTQPVQLDMPSAPVFLDTPPVPIQEVVDHTPEEERALATFRRWVDAHRHDATVLRAAMRVLQEAI